MNVMSHVMFIRELEIPVVIPGLFSSIRVVLLRGREVETGMTTSHDDGDPNELAACTRVYGVWKSWYGVEEAWKSLQRVRMGRRLASTCEKLNPECDPLGQFIGL